MKKRDLTYLPRLYKTNGTSEDSHRMPTLSEEDKRYYGFDKDDEMLATAYEKPNDDEIFDLELGAVYARLSQIFSLFGYNTHPAMLDTAKYPFIIDFDKPEQVNRLFNLVEKMAGNAVLNIYVMSLIHPGDSEATRRLKSLLPKPQHSKEETDNGQRQLDEMKTEVDSLARELGLKIKGPATGVTETVSMGVPTKITNIIQ